MSHNLEDDIGEQIRRKVDGMLGEAVKPYPPVIDGDAFADLKAFQNLLDDLPPQPRIVVSEKCPPEHASYVWMTNGAQCFYFSPDVIEKIAAERGMPDSSEPLAAGQLAPMWGVPIEYDYMEVGDGSD